MSIFNQAVESVHKRGFHSAVPSIHFHNVRLMAQLARLAEEIGEWSESWGNVSELADVVIVVAQVAWLLQVDLHESTFDVPTSQTANLSEMLGTLTRGLRKNDATMIAMSLNCLVADCVLLARENGVLDLKFIIQAKLTADEKRGYLHGARLN
jgi:hypothetical protein